MLDIYIKYYLLLVLSFYLYAKLLHLTSKANHIIYNMILFLFTNYLVCYIRVNFSYLTILIVLAILFLHMLITYRQSSLITMTTVILSTGICYLLFLVASIIVSFIIALLFFNNAPSYVQYINLVLSLLLQFCVCILLLKNKRMQKGMPFLYSKLSNSIGIFIACCILLISSLLTVLDPKNALYGLTIIASTTLGIILCIWWRKQMTLLYVNRAAQNEISRLEEELTNLRHDNERLGAIIHKDNKLIPAMIMSVQSALSSLNAENLDHNTELQSLLTELEKLSAERSLLTKKQLEVQNSIPATNITRLDMMLKYMQQSADKSGIQLNAVFNTDISRMFSDQFTEDNLVTLVADLVENAIIATKLSFDAKEILIDFTRVNDFYCIDIYDTGIPFEPYTIVNAGIKKASTHLDTGGSGIGLMTTFTLLRECSGSFVIDEAIDMSPYNKKVSIVLDSLCEYRVHSHREEILNLHKSNPNILFI